MVRGQETLFYWEDPETGMQLYDVEMDGVLATTTFESEDAAVEAYEAAYNRVDDTSVLESMNLYKQRRKDKVMEAVEVFTEQQGFDDLLQD